ncbi:MULTISPECIES: glutamine--fructose-6-phosphate transaminase (isomerizing) [Salinibaculum]|uniref:glutamine--fructose-6-phosphate transaminase (isomerizing) n=1 Tax=Salinibaculum TaxID=2732368 RepID=UPI0030CC07BA
MCGITGCVGTGEAVSCLLDGLSNLEYRGYDSAGLAVLDGDGLSVCKREGEVSELEAAVDGEFAGGSLGVGHTRWSTHGPPTDANAHPHTGCDGRVAVVHNGIIDNHERLRERLQRRGHEFRSDTDTEVVPHLVEEFLAGGADAGTAFRRAVDELSGSYAIVMVVDGVERLFATRSGSPLVLGVDDDACYLASDVPAFLEHTDRVVYLEDGDVLSVEAGEYTITDGDGYHVDRPVRTVDWTPEDAQKEGYDHYMLKEIHEQPMALRRALRGRIDAGIEVPAWLLDHPDGVPVRFVACGTSYHAALYAVELLQKRGISAQASLASEFATSPPPLVDGSVVVGVTQSGETADTLGALRRASEAGARTLAVTNVVGSTAARECDDAIFIRAGPEIGVAATKTFSSQVVTLALLAERLADADTGILQALSTVPDALQYVLDHTTAPQVARTYADASAYFFVGRGVAHSVSLEGALKLKEISYEHAEGFPAGELKHGPLALVTPETPVFAIETGDHSDRMRGTVEEVQARGAPVVAVTHPESAVAAAAETVLPIPETHPELAGLLANAQLQLLSYHTARLLDRPVDKPRNLAKSVTVE